MAGPGLHLWVPGTHVGWVGIGFLWCWRAWGCTLGCQDPVTSGGRWVPLSAGFLWVGGHWGAPLGAGDPMGWVGVGFLWVPLGWRALGCTLGCQDPIGSGGRWVPLGAGSLWVRGIGGAPLGATGWVGVGSLWFGWHGGAPLGAKTPLVWVGVGFPQVLGVSLGWRALGGTLGCWGSLWLDEHWDLLGRALGCTFGCRDSRGADGRWVPSQAGGPYGSEGFGAHPCCWCPRGWVGAPMGAGGPYGWMRTGISLGGRWAAPLGARTHVEQVGIGCPWVLGLPMGQKALGCTLSPAPYGGGLGAPMGAGVPLSSIPPCSAPWRTS